MGVRPGQALMSNVAKLKKQAAELEAKKQFDKALAVYVKLLDAFDEHAEELDVSLFNRVGDLMLRQGNVADAVDYYEQAVDRYADTKLFNNAIALCNKILRTSPGRTSIYYKLGKIAAVKGFKNDAKNNFLEYADRMQKAGKVDEAFRALKEFADLSPDQVEIRHMLAEQLLRIDRKSEALEQLQLLHERYDSEGSTTEASATAARIRAIDPTAEPRTGGEQRKSYRPKLVFLDLDAPPVRPSGQVPVQSGSQARVPTPVMPSAPVSPPASIAPPAIAPVSLTPVDEVAIELSVQLEPTFTPLDTAARQESLAEDTDLLEAHESIEELDATEGATLDEALAAAERQAAELEAAEREAAESRAAKVLDEILDEGSRNLSGDRADQISDEESPTALERPSLTGVERLGEDAPQPNETPTASLLGLESTRLGGVDELELPPPESLLDLEPTSLAAPGAPPVHRSPAPTHGHHDDVADEIEVPEPRLSPRDTASIDFDLDDLVPGDAQPPARPKAAALRDSRALIDEEDAVIEMAPQAPLAPKPAESIDLPDFDLLSAAAETFEIVDDVADEPFAAAADTLDQTADVVDDRAGEMLVTPPATPPFGHDLDERLGREAIETPQSADLISTGTAEESLDEQPLLAVPRSTPAHSRDDDSLQLLDEPLSTGDYEPVVVPTPSIARRSTAVAVQTVEILRVDVQANPQNWGLRRQLAEAMLEAGDRVGGLQQLDAAMTGAEGSGDLDFASSLAEEIARLEPEVVRHHQKRVEYAFRTNDRPRLIEAYVSLADALLRSDQGDKARIIYQRVLDLAPDEPRARSAIDTLVSDDEPAEPMPTPATPRTTMAPPKAVQPRPAEANGAPSAGPREFVNLGDWLRDDEAPRDTRMVVAEQEPTGDEQADFADMLRKFKQGVAENVDPEDYQSHYDLAIAYKEMGLLDEAIAEFQKALGSPTNRLPTFEALGQCFMEQGQFKLASSVLGRALNEKGSEDQLVGVLYLLGRAAEAQGRADEALGFYQRVFVLDIQFRDIAERMSEVERAAR
jgi:tetratricopeptide (TPR) repeat protein